MKTYSHVSDCWDAIREAKSINEVKQLISQFPIWSGSWTIEIEDYPSVGKNYVVCNYYMENDIEQLDRETLSIPYVPEDFKEAICELADVDWNYGNTIDNYEEFTKRCSMRGIIPTEELFNEYQSIITRFKSGEYR